MLRLFGLLVAPYMPLCSAYMKSILASDSCITIAVSRIRGFRVAAVKQRVQVAKEALLVVKWVINWLNRSMLLRLVNGILKISVSNNRVLRPEE